MTIDWNGIKTSVANAISSAMGNAMSLDLARWPVPGIPLAATYTWDGSNTVLTPDTSEVSDSPASFIKLVADGNWYKVIAIDPNVSVTVQDFYSVGSFPSGSSGTEKASSACPNCPSQGGLNGKFGTPIANAVIDGVKTALDQAVINDVAEDVGNTVGPGVIV